jgi:hypothetical protein
MATLLIVVILTLIMGMLALTASSSVVVEQRMTGNDIRSREAREAAEAVLSQGKAWAFTQKIAEDMQCPGHADCPALADRVGSSSGTTYTPSLIFEVGALGSIKVTASTVGDDAVSARVEDWIRQVSLINGSVDIGGIILGGGLSGVNGNPVIDSPTAVIYNSNAVSASDIDKGAFNKKPKDPSFGDVVGVPFPDTDTPAWDFVFNVSLDHAIAQADLDGYRSSLNTLPSEPEQGKGPFMVWDRSTHIHSSFGTADNPVVVIIPDECPKINGSPTIYGIVYFGNEDCGDKQGWGGATIIGAIVVDGGISKLTANSEFLSDKAHANTGVGDLVIFASSLPGSWKDF